MNVQEIKVGGITYVFVSRDTPMSKEEIDKFFSGEYLLEDKYTGEAKQFVPDNRDRVRIFLKDLKNGIEWCSSKYGVTHDDVIAEAKRIAPHLKVV